ncbi:hypothetical protein [Sphingopyxis sp. 22461]|uniref:hypothetical protein n=1 Tax=Sphingopyxis sp. 22461 TaxID=3453923 RepID=UPI003F87244A
MTLTKEQRTAAIKWLADLPPHILREKIERGYDFGSGKTFSDKGKIMEVLQQTACIAEMLADRLAAVPSALSGDAGEGEWQPRIGDEVRASEGFLSRYGEWRDVPLFVAGICKDRGVPGLNVSVSEKWPVDLNSDGYTDGFYIGRDHCPDDLVPVAALPSHQGAE